MIFQVKDPPQHSIAYPWPLMSSHIFSTTVNCPKRTGLTQNHQSSPNWTPIECQSELQSPTYLKELVLLRPTTLSSRWFFWWDAHIPLRQMCLHQGTIQFEEPIFASSHGFKSIFNQYIFAQAIYARVRCIDVRFVDICFVVFLFSSASPASTFLWHPLFSLASAFLFVVCFSCWRPLFSLTSAFLFGVHFFSLASTFLFDVHFSLWRPPFSLASTFVWRPLFSDVPFSLVSFFGCLLLGLQPCYQLM